MEAKTTNPTTIPAKCETLSYDGYTLQWEDDFNGPELNREDWNVELHEPGWVNHELQAYIDSPQTIYIQNSSLVLKPVEKKNPDGTVSYISGRVNTQLPVMFQCGLAVGAAVQTGRCPEAAGVGGEHHRGQCHRLDAHDAEHRQDDRQTAAPHTGKVMDAENFFRFRYLQQKRSLLRRICLFP